MSPRDQWSTMSRADAERERLDDDAAAVLDICPAEAEKLEVEAMQAIGFYPPEIPEPPF